MTFSLILRGGHFNEIRTLNSWRYTFPMEIWFLFYLLYRDGEEFCRVLTATDGLKRRIILGHAAAGIGEIPGEQFDSSQAAAVILHDAVDCSDVNCLYIFIPKERSQKGTE